MVPSNSQPTFFNCQLLKFIINYILKYFFSLVLFNYKKYAMARIGEGDPRWIVNEREDGRNVNSWHW